MKLHALAVALLASLAASQATAQSANGSGGDMPALYDGQTFTINFKEMPDGAAAVLLANNTSINIIYVSEDLLPDGTPFVAVLDAIQGDGFNPLCWRWRSSSPLAILLASSWTTTKWRTRRPMAKSPSPRMEKSIAARSSDRRTNLPHCSSSEAFPPTSGGKALAALPAVLPE